MECPECKHGGRKDEACTHMTCAKCETNWCYVCGQKESDLDQACLSSHNELWQSNSQRCPIYLHYIRKIDKRWSRSSEECLDYFHRIKTITLLRKFIDEINIAGYKQLCESFP